MRLGVVLAVAATAVAAIAGVSRTASPTAELLPDLVQELPDSLDVSTEGGRFRLGFRSRVTNEGAGPLVVSARRPDHRTPTMQARQRVRLVNGHERPGRLVGRLRYERAETHTHWHLLPFEHYELRAAGQDHASSLALKQGFCLGDRYRDPDARRRHPPAFTHECGKGRPRLLELREGISVGHGDDYRAHLEGQAFDVSDLPAGEYVLVNVVNPDRLIRESDYTNNAASLLVSLEWPNGPGASPRVQILAECRSSAGCSR